MKSILIGERYRSFFEKSLENQGFEPIWTPDNPLLDPRLSGHTDLSAIKLGKKLIVSRHIYENGALVKKITNRGLEVICCRREQGCVYPKDVNLCACAFGEYLIHNFALTDEAIIENSHLRKIDARQGYANCMVQAVDSGIITADNGIEARAAEQGIDVLKITQGQIRLEGFEEGFIGGASFVCGDIVYFTGDIDTHPDADSIKAFIEASGYKICCLSNGMLIDIGSAVVLD